MRAVNAACIGVLCRAWVACLTLNEVAVVFWLPDY